MLDPFWSDVIRTAAIALLVLCVGAVATVFRLHVRAARTAPRDVGLLPWHVAAVSLAVLLPYAALAWGIAESLGRPASPEFLVRTGMYMLGAVFLLASLWIVAGLQRRRIQFGRSESRTVRTVRSETTSVDREPPR